MSKKIILTGGGTAGHVTPNIALIPGLKEKGYEIKYIGSYDGIEKKLIEMSKEYATGNPKDPSTKLGPLASLRQYEKVKSYIESGIRDGAKLLCGTVPKQPQKGYYISPAIFTHVTPSMSIAEDEIFGPVLCVFPYETEEEAVQIANNTRYGLNAGVYGEKEKAVAIAKQLEAGNVYINASPRDTAAPFGGYKQSGLGREGGIYGMLEFTQQKAVFDTGK